MRLNDLNTQSSFLEKDSLNNCIKAFSVIKKNPSIPCNPQASVLLILIQHKASLRKGWAPGRRRARRGHTETTPTANPAPERREEARGGGGAADSERGSRAAVPTLCTEQEKPRSTSKLHLGGV